MKNINEACQEMSWYKGPSLLKAIDTSTIPERSLAILRLPIFQTYEGKLCGIICSGQLKKNDSVIYDNQELKIQNIDGIGAPGNYVLVSFDSDVQTKNSCIITNPENKIHSAGIKHLRVEIKMLQDADSIHTNDTLKLFTNCQS